MTPWGVRLRRAFPGRRRFWFSFSALLLLAANTVLLMPLSADHAPRPRSLAVNAFSPVGDESRESDGLRATGPVTYSAFLPFVASSTCELIPAETYGTVAVLSAKTDPPAEVHPDLNLSLRGYVQTTAELGLVDLGGVLDPGAPQLAGIFGDNRVPAFKHVYRVYDWDWSCNCRGAPLDNYAVTLAGMGTTTGEIIRVPASAYNIGHVSTDYEVMVLYAAPDRLTLKYTRDDNVVIGYTIHLENMCVEPRLLALYEQMNSSGRSRLPALFAGQGVGRARGSEIGVTIRDTGMFMDPRSRQDWWQGR